MSIRNLSIAVVVLATAASASAGEPATKPAFTLAKDTTCITKPLLPDGRPDYVEALNREYGKGVTPKNNAAVPLIEAFGPNFLPKKTSAILLKKLGMKAPKKGKWFGKFFKPLPDDPDLEDDHDDALEGPWRMKDFPKLDKWLKSNAAPLAKVVAASKRKRYFMPLVTSKKKLRMLSVLVPSLVKVRGVAYALVIRSNLALAKGRTEDAWADVQAVHRLAALLEQDSFLIGQLVGIAVRGLAEDATLRLVTSGKVSLHELRRMLKELPPYEAARTISIPVDKGERFMILDTVLEASRSPKDFLDLLRRVSGERDSPVPEPFRKQIVITLKDGVDRDHILRRVNALFDLQVKAMRSSDDKGAKAAEELEKRIGFAGAEFALWPLKGRAAKLLEKRAKGGNAKTRWAGSVLINMLFPRLTRLQTLADKVGVRRELTVLSIGLAIYHAEKGRYPVRLGLLAPKYLKTVPKDFFSGKNFVYKRKGRGYVLYSVGKNAKDDGGKGRDSDGDDLVVQTDK